MTLLRDEVRDKVQDWVRDEIRDSNIPYQTRPVAAEGGWMKPTEAPSSEIKALKGQKYPESGL